MKLNFSFIKTKIDFKHLFSKETNFKNLDGLKESTSSIISHKSILLEEVSVEKLFSYHIFPSYIMDFKAQWLEENRPMKVGDIIYQRVFFPPIGFGFCMEFSVRISNIFKGEKIGFAYETLEGHVEKGLSEFYFQQKEDNIEFVIHTYSKPAYKFLEMTKYVVALPYQKFSTTEALKNMMDIIK